MNRKALAAIVAVLAIAGTAFYLRGGGDAAGPPGARAGGPGGGPGGGFGGSLARPPLTVEVGSVTREAVEDQIMVVGSLVGAATVDVAPNVSGRLREVHVRIGDQVTQGQVVATVDDREILQQVRQAEAAFEVAGATVRQREADLEFARTNVERSRSLFDRQLLSRQDTDNAEATFQAAQAQLELGRALYDQAGARLEELRITAADTRIVSPVNGFVGKRYLDPGAFVSSNAPVVSIVNIGLVRLVVNLIENDLRLVHVGTPGVVEVDAFPGERFEGSVARLAPVLDPATRTAEIEVEVQNPDFRLKPGMYARVLLTVGERGNALVVPRNAVVSIEGTRGVFVVDGAEARFRRVTTGIENQERSEVLDGVELGEVIVTTGAQGLRDGDPINVSGQDGPSGRTDRAESGGRGAADTNTAGPAEPDRDGARPQADPRPQSAGTGAGAARQQPASTAP